MFFNLLATFMIGVLAASVVFVLIRASGGRLPKWLMPVAAGAAMLGYNIWNEYTWYARTVATLPAKFVLADAAAPSASPLSPWTYAVGRVESFRVLDTTTAARNPKRPGYVIAQLYRLQRLSPAAKTSVILDCNGRQVADITPSTTFDDDGFPTNVTWSAIPSASRLPDLLCPAASAAPPKPATPAAPAATNQPTTTGAPSPGANAPSPPQAPAAKP